MQSHNPGAKVILSNQVAFRGMVALLLFGLCVVAVVGGFGTGWSSRSYSVRSSDTIKAVSSSNYEYGSLRHDDSACPTWLHQYVQFHVEQRGKPGAKYLVHLVDGVSGGLGDRLNGALAMLRLAAALNRVLLLSWAKPKPYRIEDFFSPPGPLNWSMQGISIERGATYHFVDTDGWNRAELHDDTLANVTDTFLTNVTNMPINGSCRNCAPIALEWSADAACLWHSIFSPTQVILDQARAELARLYPRGPSPYVAVHLRLGGLTGEEGAPGPDRGLSPLPNFIAGVRCGVQLARSRHIGLTATPALVITDNHYLRKGLQENLLGNMVAPGGLPVHLDRADGQSLQAHRNTVVDMVLLGWGECLVTSRSGFSLHAWLFGGAKECAIPFKSCL